MEWLSLRILPAEAHGRRKGLLHQPFPPYKTDEVSNKAARSRIAATCVGRGRTCAPRWGNLVSNVWKTVTNRIPSLGKEQQFTRLKIEREYILWSAPATNGRRRFGVRWQPTGDTAFRQSGAYAKAAWHWVNHEVHYLHLQIIIRVANGPPHSKRVCTDLGSAEFMRLKVEQEQIFFGVLNFGSAFQYGWVEQHALKSTPKLRGALRKFCSYMLRTPTPLPK